MMKENQGEEETKEMKETKETKEMKGTKEMKETKETKETKEMDETKEMKGEGAVRQIEEMGLKLAEMNDKYIRLSAEFDNYRKRTLKERMELMKSAGEQVLEDILPVMDNFERGLASMEMAKDVPALREGVELIYGNFKTFLLQNGVKEMECLHVDFDPDLHEAVTKIPASTEELKGKIVDCIQKGYTLHDKVIRFPKVVVGE